MPRAHGPRKKAKSGKRLVILQISNPQVSPAWRDAADTFMFAGKWVPVISSNVAAIRYDHKKRELHVRFKKNPGGYYRDVPPHTAREMFGASSMGLYVHERLKGKYGYSPYR